MAIAINATKSTLSDAYKGIGAYVGLATGGGPGSSATPTNESTGGGYARVQGTWGTSTNGVVTFTSAVTINVPASTVTFVFLSSLASGAGQFDNADISDITFSATGQAVVTPTFTVT